MPPKPRILTDDELKQVEKLSSILSVEQMSDYLGIGRTTFYEIMKRQPIVSEHYKRGRAKAIGAIGGGLLQKARAGDTASTIFYLKTQAGWRETEQPKDIETAKPLNISFTVENAGKDASS
jgi:hypothetical protein